MGYFDQITHIIALIWYKNDNVNTSLVSSVSKCSDTKETFFFLRRKLPGIQRQLSTLCSVLSPFSFQGSLAQWWEKRPRWEVKPPRAIILLSSKCCWWFYFYFIDSLEMFFIVLWPQGPCSKMILHSSNPVLEIAIKKEIPEDNSPFSLRTSWTKEMHPNSWPSDSGQTHSLTKC